MTETLLSVDQVAYACGLSKRAIYDAIRRGELPALRLCHRLRIRPHDLDAWMHAATVTPPQPIPPSPISVTELHGRSKPTRAAGSFRDLLADGGGGREAA
ncbi:MAG TPA: helix-turn-helix domain-containing protein [Baekduia sp.]|nr:helix-turn-helix domain-containing protein [Baekduia sp.]